MEYIIPLIIGIAVGAVIGMLSNKSKIAAESARNAMLQSEAERLKAEAVQMRNEYENRLQSAQENAEKQAIQLQENAAKQLSQLQENAEKQLRQQQEDAAARFAAAKDEAREALGHERNNSERMRRESDRQWEQKLEALRQEMQKNAAEQLAAKQRDLQESNRTQMDELLKPIKEQFADFKKAVEEILIFQEPYLWRMFCGSRLESRSFVSISLSGLPGCSVSSLSIPALASSRLASISLISSFPVRIMYSSS